MCDNSWIKLHRQTLKWEWFDDSLMVHLWVYILLKSNYTDAKWHGIEIERGQFITSIATLCRDLKSTESRIKTALKRLKNTNQIEAKTTNKFTIITVLNWDTYQSVSQTNDNQIANNSQTNDNQIATDKEYKNNKKERNKEEYKSNIRPPESKASNDIPPTKVVGASKDFIFELLNIFSEEYFNARKFTFDSMNEGPERKALGKMLAMHKKKYPDFTSEKTKEFFRNYFIKCLSINEKWHYERMSPSHIFSQNTSIQAILKNNPNGVENGKPKTANLSFLGIE